MSLKLKKNDKKTKVNIIGGCSIAVVGIIGALWLLIGREAISGAEFVVLSLGFSVIGLIIVFVAEIQEFSIAGNGVKLKDLRSEAEKTIEELDRAKIEIFKFLVLKSTEITGGYYRLENDIKTINYFIKLFENIEKFDCIKPLESELKKSLNILLLQEYRRLSIVHKKDINQDYIFLESDTPQNLYLISNDQVIKSYGEKKNIFDIMDAKKALFMDFERYAKLYVIKVKLDNLEIDYA